MSEIEVYQAGRAKIRMMAVGGVLLLVGVTVGFLLGHSTAPARPPAVASVASESPESDLSKASEPKASEPEGALNEPTSEAKGETKIAEPATGTGQTPPPLNGAVPSGPIPDTLPGSISPGSVAPVNPVVIETPPNRGGLAEYREYTLVVAEADVAGTRQRLLDLLREFQGQTSLQFTHDPDRPELGQDLLASLPAERAASFFESLNRMSGSQETDRWSGAAEDRDLRMKRFLREAVNGLEKRVRELKVRYLDDAPEVVRNSEMQAHYRKGLESVKSIPAARPAVRIFVGKSLPPWG